MSWEYQRGFCEGGDRTGMCKKAGRGLPLAACGSDYGMEFTASPN